MAVEHVAAHRDRVHDREDAGLLVVVHLDVEEVLEQPADIRMAVVERGGGVRAASIASISPESSISFRLLSGRGVSFTPAGRLSSTFSMRPG